MINLRTLLKKTMRKLSRLLVGLFVAAVLTTQLADQKRTAASARLKGITMEMQDAEKSRAHVKFLASDLLEGRGTGQRGGDIAAEYIATQFELYGLKPAGENGNYFQDVPMMGVKTLPDTSFKLVPANGQAITLKNLDDFVTTNDSQPYTAHIDSPLLFAPYRT